jgi:hypothetical protein
MKAHIDDGPTDVNLHEAMAVRDDLRELAEQLSEESKYDMPEVGDTMYDGRCPVDVVEVTDYTAELYHIENGDGVSVAQYRENEDYDPQSPVVKVTYPSGEKEYAMPLARLSHEK